MGENLYEKLWKTPGKRAYDLRESLNSEFRALQIHGKLPFKERPIPAMSRTKGIHEQVRKRNHEAVTSILVERPSVITSRDWKLYATPLHIAAELRMLNTIKNMLSPTIITFTEAVINSQGKYNNLLCLQKNIRLLWLHSNHATVYSTTSSSSHKS